MTPFDVGIFIVLLSHIPVGHFGTVVEVPYKYMAIIDAGSTGSRIYVFQWIHSQPDVEHGIPKVQEVDNLKKKPGLSSLADDPDGVKNHLAPLLKFAQDNIPRAKYSETPIYLMATAGIRLVEASKRNVIFARVHATFEDSTMSPFKYNRGNSRILSGEEEGAFTWISVNFNSGFLTNSSKNAKSVGIVEMGGASAQVAFIPEGQILADKFPVRVGKRYYSLYVHSYLYFGQETTASRVREHLHGENPDASVLDNPCMLRDDTDVQKFRNKNVTFRGSSNHTACRAITRPFIWKVSADRCHPSPCTIGSVYQPLLGDSTFYAVQALVYTPSDLGILPASGKMKLPDITAASDSFCAKNLEDGVAQIGERSREYASARCTMSTFIPMFLHEGLGFAEDGNQLTFSNKIGDKSLDWTLGAVLYEIGRLCGGEGPTSNAIPVFLNNTVIMLSISCLLAAWYRE